MNDDTPVTSILVYVGSNPDDAIGENILKLPFLRTIGDHYPHACITWIAGVGPCQFEGVLAPVAGDRIAECLTGVEIRGGPRELLFRHRPLGDRRFGIVFDLQQNAGRTLILKRIRHDLFISGCWNYRFSDRKPPAEFRNTPLLTDRLLGLAAAATGDATRPPPVWPLADHWTRLAGKLLPGDRDYVGIAPGAGKKGTGKVWPLDRYIDLAHVQFRKGRIPVFFIRPDETDWLQRIRQDADFAMIPEADAMAKEAAGPALAMALAQRLKAAVANCSGIGHILAAGGAPMVSLFGPTQPEKYAPYATRLISLRAKDFGGTTDIENIPLEAVSDAIDAQLTQTNV